MSKLGTLPFLLLPLVGACATAVEAPENAAPPASDPTPEAEADEDGDEEERAKKREELAFELEIARAQLGITKLEADAQAAKQEVKLRHAEAEVEMARVALVLFRDLEAPRRVASEELSLRSTKDRAQEAAEELAQIEIMYEDQDLDDVTAEFVVSRGRRTAERAAQRIEIQEAAFRALQEHELPQETKRLELAVERAEAALADAKREAEIGRRRRGIEMKEARRSIEKLEEELAELADDDEGADA